MFEIKAKHRGEWGGLPTTLCFKEPVDSLAYLPVGDDTGTVRWVESKQALYIKTDSGDKILAGWEQIPEKYIDDRCDYDAGVAPLVADLPDSQIMKPEPVPEPKEPEPTAFEKAMEMLSADE